MSKNRQIDGLKVVMLAQLLVEAIDDMKGTSLYKQNIKKAGNNFVKMLEQTVRQNDKVYKSDPELATNLYNEVDGLISKMAELNMVDLTMINQIYQQYSKNKEDWQNLFEIEMTKLDSA
jgi:hypothetical protein